jgi:peptidoglycan/xylan/chitin deacetylase (PgdA/CDA1 family)
MVSKTDMKTTYMSTKQKIANPIINATSRLGFLDAYSILKRYFGSQIVILTYHRVGPNNNAWLLPPTSASDFEKQMKYLTKAHKIMPLNKLAEVIREGKSLEEKIAVVTFDDGYKDSHLYAFPILKKYNIPATIFLITGHIDTGNLFWFDKIRYIILNTKMKRIELDDLGDFSLNSIDNKLKSMFIIVEKLKRIPDEKKNNFVKKLTDICDVNIPSDLGREYILSWDEVKEMNECGVDFGAHTVTHPILTRISSDQARFEILQSRKDIEKQLGQSVNTFCYPNGTLEDFNSEIIDIVKESGFTCAVTTLPTINPSKTNLYKLGRLPDPWSFDSFKFFASGLYSDASSVLNRMRRYNVYQ